MVVGNLSLLVLCITVLIVETVETNVVSYRVRIPAIITLNYLIT